MAVVTDTVIVPTVQLGASPSPTPTIEETTIATLPTSTPTPTSDFSELTAGDEATATPLPTPAPTATPEVTASVEVEGTTYSVRWGDTLFTIAQSFGTTVDDIKALNGLTDDFIIVGQELIVPGDFEVPSDIITAPSGAGGVHIVQPGENLFRIALRYGTTVDAIARANNIVNPWFIYVGQELTIPGGSGDTQPTGRTGKTHVVQRGETLYSIAVRYGTTVQAMVVANNLSSPNLIYVGQTLKVP